MPLDEERCGRCGELVLDHTLRDFKAHHASADLNLPYEEDPRPTWQDLADQHGPMSGSLTCASAVLQTSSEARAAGAPAFCPAVAFTFFAPDGRTVAAKALLVLDAESMRRVRQVIVEAMNGAIRATGVRGPKVYP